MIGLKVTGMYSGLSQIYILPSGGSFLLADVAYTTKNMVDHIIRLNLWGNQQSGGDIYQGGDSA